MKKPNIEKTKPDEHDWNKNEEKQALKIKERWNIMKNSRVGKIPGNDKKRKKRKAAKLKSSKENWHMK